MELIKDWQMEDLLDLLEENPEVEQMTLEQLKVLEQDLYREASWKFDEGSGLIANTTYTVKVYAISTYAVESLPLTVTFTTSEGKTDITPDIFSFKFNEDGSATETISGTTLTKKGAPTVSYNETLKMYVADFDGTDDAFCYDGTAPFYVTMNNLGWTFEIYIYADKKPTTTYSNPVSNQQSGGFGFEYNTNGTMEISAHIGGGYKSADTTVSTGKWVHLVATHDGSQLKLYVDGVLKKTISASGKVQVPNENARALVLGGDSGANGAVSNYFDGKMAICNMYSEAMSAVQINALYNNIG